MQATTSSRSRVNLKQLVLSFRVLCLVVALWLIGMRWPWMCVRAATRNTTRAFANLSSSTQALLFVLLPKDFFKDDADMFACFRDLHLCFAWGEGELLHFLSAFFRECGDMAILGQEFLSTITQVTLHGEDLCPFLRCAFAASNLTAPAAKIYDGVGKLQKPMWRNWRGKTSKKK